MSSHIEELKRQLEVQVSKLDGQEGLGTKETPLLKKIFETESKGEALEVILQRMARIATLRTQLDTAKQTQDLLRDVSEVEKQGVADIVNALERSILRHLRFGQLKSGKNALLGKNQVDAHQKILENYTEVEQLRASDILFLKQNGADLTKLLLVPTENAYGEIDKNALKEQALYTVNFWEKDNKLNLSIGAGDIFPPTVTKITVNGVEWERENAPRPGYYRKENGKKIYLPIYDGDKIKILTVGTLSVSEMQESQAADASRFKKIRILDSVEQNGKPLTDLEADKALAEEIKVAATKRSQWKEKIKERESAGDVIEFTKFRMGQWDFENIAGMVGLSTENIPKVQAIMSAIGKQESQSNYGAQGQLLPSGRYKGERAIGRYQIMPTNWANWSEKYFHEILEVTPENQDKVAFAEISSYYMKYSRRGMSLENIISEISQDWYGRGRPQISGHPTSTSYARSVISIYDKHFA